MGTLSRQQWADLRFAHPCRDLANPTDEFAQALITATGGDPDVWVTGGTTDALTAYREALACRPGFEEAARLLEVAPEVEVEVRVCLDAGIPYSAFLAWDERSQDLALAAAVKRANTCPVGHPRDAMGNPDLVNVTRVYCAVCAQVHEVEAKVAQLSDDHRIGWHTEVSRVSG